MNHKRKGWKKIAGSMHFVIDSIVLAILFLLALYGGYGIWDSHLLVNQGLAEQYERYKPKKETESFQQLQAINKDVVGWLDVYGTNIDYPIVQGEDDWKYINTDVKGNYSLTGALFLSSRNKADFSDFNSIIYGHNMTPRIMFGNIKDFRDRAFFEEHKYGELFDGKQEYGICFFAVLNVDAYDTNVYKIANAEKNAYVEHLLEMSLHKREVDIEEGDRIVLLSTCSTTETNGRDILVGKITKERYPNTFTEEEKSPITILRVEDWVKKVDLPLWVKAVLCLIFVLFALLVLYLVIRRRRRRKQKYERPGQDTADPTG